MTVVAPTGAGGGAGAAPAGPTGGGGGGGGSARNNALIAAVVAVAGIIVIVFSLASPKKPDEPQIGHLQDTGQIGLQYAASQLQHDNWTLTETYDAYGENRGVHDRTQWKVCFQDPAPGAVKNTEEGADPRSASLGVVKLDEACPVKDGQPKDYGELDQVYDSASSPGTHRIPDLTGYTPFMVRRAFGQDASIDVLKLPVQERTTDSGNVVVRLVRRLRADVFSNPKNPMELDTVTDDSGDWAICKQNPLPDAEPWNGRVISVWVIPVEDITDRGDADSVCGPLLAAQATT